MKIKESSCVVWIIAIIMLHALSSCDKESIEPVSPDETMIESVLINGITFKLDNKEQTATISRLWKAKNRIDIPDYVMVKGSLYSVASVESMKNIGWPVRDGIVNARYPGVVTIGENVKCIDWDGFMPANCRVLSYAGQYCLDCPALVIFFTEFPPEIVGFKTKDHKISRALVLPEAEQAFRESQWNNVFEKIQVLHWPYGPCGLVDGSSASESAIGNQSEYVIGNQYRINTPSDGEAILMSAAIVTSTESVNYIPDEVEIEGVHYKIVGIADAALYESRHYSFTPSSHNPEYNELWYQNYENNKMELRIGPNIRWIGNYAFLGAFQIDKVMLEGETPPEISSTSFKGIRESALFYVKPSALEAYRTSPCWQPYVSRLRVME